MGFRQVSVMSRRIGLAGLAGMVALVLSAPSQAIGPDVSGGADHPIVSRFAGSQMVGYQQLDFDTGQFFLPNKASGFDPAKEIDPAKPVLAEGKLTRLVYVAPAGKSALEVHRNFEQALKAAGLKVLTSVDGRNAWWNPGQHWRANFSNASFLSPFAADISPFDREGLYLYGTLSRGGVDVAVSVLSGPVNLFTRSHYKTGESTAQAAVAIQIVEPRAMATGQVTASAEAIGKGLDAEGRIALYGLHFDTGKSEIKPSSKPQLDEMAAVLKARPTLRVHIVGHTDNVGSLDANLALSLKRAEAVVAALVNTHRIDARRLNARGVASLSPVASNRSEAGRALNRRVELVEQ